MRLILFTLLLVDTLTSSAQSAVRERIDSLLNVWNDPEQSDTARLIALSGACKQGYLFSNPDSAIILAKAEMEFSMSVGNSKYQADALNMLGTATSLKMDFVAAIDLYRKCLSLRESYGDQRGVAAVLNNIGQNLIYIGDSSGALESLRRSLSISERIGDEQGKAISWNKIGDVFRNNDRNRAISSYQSGLASAEKMGDKRIILNTLNKMGAIYQSQGRFSAAVECLSKSIEQSNEMGDKAGVAYATNNIAMVYHEKGDYAEALDLYMTSLKICMDLGDIKSASAALVNMAAIQEIFGEDSIAIDYLNQSIDMKERSNDKAGMAAALNNIASIQMDKDPDLSFSYSRRAFLIAKEVGNKSSEAVALCGMGESMRRIGSENDAHSYLSQSLRLFTELDDYKGIAACLSNLALLTSEGHGKQGSVSQADSSIGAARISGSVQTILNSLEYSYEAHKKLGEYRLALGAFEQYISLRDSVLSNENERAVIRQQVRYDYDRQKVVDSLRFSIAKDLIASERTIERMRADRNRNSAWAISLGALILFAGGGLYYWADRKRRQASADRRAAELEIRALRAQMNPHFLFNALNSINDHIQDNDTEVASDFLLRFSRLMRQVLEISRLNEVPLARELELIGQYAELERMRLKDRFSLSVEVAPEVDARTVGVPPMILQPFVENAIWHGLSRKSGPGHLRILVTRQSGALRIAVEDDGVGRSTNAITEKEGHKSLGTTITKERLDLWGAQHGAQASFSYVPSHAGTRVELVLPVVFGDA